VGDVHLDERVGWAGPEQSIEGAVGIELLALLVPRAHGREDRATLSDLAAHRILGEQHATCGPQALLGHRTQPSHDHERWAGLSGVRWRCLLGCTGRRNPGGWTREREETKRGKCQRELCQ